MPVVIEWDWIDLHLSVTIEKSSTIHGFYHFWISRGWKLKNFFELVWAFWVYLANRETTNTSHFSSGHVCFDIFNCEPKKAHGCVINSKNDSPATWQKSFSAGLDFYFDFGHDLNKNKLAIILSTLTHCMWVSFSDV